MYNYKQILEWKFSSCDYIITNEYDYDTLVWNDSSEKPSRELLETKIDLIKASELLVVQQKRASEYPPIGDQLDALWKGGTEAATMLEKVQAVKAKYPKPI